MNNELYNKDVQVEPIGEINSIKWVRKNDDLQEVYHFQSLLEMLVRVGQNPYDHYIGFQ